jgi:CDP-2,3-bis-(O-geranylgeranyl)-sn-glycerol synthase
MNPLTVAQLLILLTLANGTPVIAKKLLGDRFAQPFDGGARFFDGRPLFGRSKTLRGIVLALVATAAGAPVIGIDWHVGLLIGATAMAGDLFSSFIKRRMGLEPSSRAVGLDQIPESLFPMLAGAGIYGLTVADIAVGVALFFVGEIVLSRVLYRLRLRDRPY